MNLEDILALGKILNLVEEFSKKNIIRTKKINFDKIRKKINDINSFKEEEKQLRLYKGILEKLYSILKKDILTNIYFIIGGHGGIIINNIGFCEFDSPNLAIDSLLKKMKLALETNMPYNLEIAISCLEWLNERLPNKIIEFLRTFKLGRFEIINPSFSQPYNLIIGPESNIKQFEYGLKVLKKLGLSSDICYCSESSLHPQIPQILKGFGIKYGSLRTRILGVNPTSHSAYINWIGLDDTSIDAIIDQSGVFNGEYWHGTFFKEIPNLLFQTVARPFIDYIVYSNLEDIRNPQPFQEDVWRVSKFSEIFGKFLQCSEFFNQIEKNGEYKFKRDEFFLGDLIFNPSELYLQNKNSEIMLISAEIVNSILGHYENGNYDKFFEDLWKNLLITQAHDCYAVPYIRSGDYSQLQLGKEGFKELKLESSRITISKLSIQINHEIQEKCQDFIHKALTQITNKLKKEKKESKDISKKILIFNPTPYTRNDVISINISHEASSKIVENIPGFGYKIMSFSDEIPPKIKKKSEFLYKIEILKDLNLIQVKFKNNEVFELKFDSKEEYTLYLENLIQDDVIQKNVLIGKFNDQAYRIEIVQYREINRLEFIFEANSQQEITLKPQIEIKKSIINYPFGIEETRRSKIQTLDFIWLKGLKQGIIYIQKNSQKFKINQKSFEIRNLIPNKGRFEFAISITNENDQRSLLFFISSYYFKLLPIMIDKNFDFIQTTNSFLSIEPPITVINLWRRKDETFLRLFNPTNQTKSINLNGSLVKDKIKEIDFNYNVITTLRNNTVNLDQWKIKTLKL